ncbi:transmembrane protein TM9SF3 [Rhizopus microsporus ATCC 52813]|uniref:Transmembrane 9 superfamily member n=2 Tax=Rhizopus microsporus TaxID=58291 RepID=A0A2G4SNP2_RHIZD|nr:transmembrane protein TM9SF3 [Rhizopus microsporus ATCC 52813]PHZ10362.1 transmembrane protein TM9SF3 [Rhizopus microsporus ATCC 52813]
MNTVGPLHNRQETYPYFQLPFCQGPHSVEHHHETLGEALLGMDLVNSGIPTQFKINEADKAYCEQELEPKDVDVLRYAVDNQYWYTMFIDDLPVSGVVGKDEEEEQATETDPHAKKLYVYTHKSFMFEYNGNQIISISLKHGNPVELKHGLSPLTFTYSVTWNPTDVLFENRFERLLEADFFEHKVHWLSIFSSFMMVLFLTGLVSVILLRTVKRDFTRYDREEGLADFDRDLGDEYGWKQVHGDVFRQPPRLMMMSALMGTGSQLVILSAVVILYTILGDLYAERATILTATIFLYAFTSFVAGYTSAKYYARYGGRDWIKTFVMTASLWPGAVSFICGLINTLAIYYSSSRAISFYALLSIIALWIFICFPLTLLGTIVGRNWGSQADFPCRVNPIPRPIPEKVWYAEPLVIVALGGILPFGSIFIEIYFIFTSFWTYKIYYVYGFMLLVFIILLIVSACVSIVSTYFLLNAEDHRWHWVSFMTCASTAGYIYLYSVYYFMTKTRMTGLFQTSFYFGYTAILSLGMFCMLGFVGHTAASKFVRKIYQNVKID